MTQPDSPQHTPAATSPANDSTISLQDLAIPADQFAQNSAQPSSLPHATQADPREALLAQLHDVKTPQEIGIWPLAMGWWLVIAVCLALTTASIAIFIHRKNKNRLRKLALQQLHSLNSKSDALNDAEFASNLIALIKRYCFSINPNARKTLAALSGARFLQFVGDTLLKETQQKREIHNLVVSKLKPVMTTIDSTLYGNPSLDLTDNQSSATTNTHNRSERAVLVELAEQSIRNFSEKTRFTPVKDAPSQQRQTERRNTESTENKEGVAHA